MVSLNRTRPHGTEASLLAHAEISNCTERPRLAPVDATAPAAQVGDCALFPLHARASAWRRDALVLESVGNGTHRLSGGDLMVDAPHNWRGKRVLNVALFKHIARAVNVRGVKQIAIEWLC